MDAAELRAMQAPIKERYKSDPSVAVITLKAKGSIDHEGLTCKVETGRALAIAGLHPATGGSGLELCSGDMLLEALVACAGVTLKSVATAVDVPAKDIELKLKKTGDLAAQLTNTEWFISMPGTAEQKRPLIECMSCHTFERIARSRAD